MTSTSRHNDVDSGIGDNSDNNNNINSSYQQQQATKETERMSAKNILPGSSFQDMGPSTMLGMLGIGSTSPILKMAYNINLQQQQQQQRDNAIVFAKINKDSLSTRTSTGTSIENRNKKKKTPTIPSNNSNTDKKNTNYEQQKTVSKPKEIIATSSLTAKKNIDQFHNVLSASPARKNKNSPSRKRTESTPKAKITPIKTSMFRKETTTNVKGNSTSINMSTEIVIPALSPKRPNRFSPINNAAGGANNNDNKKKKNNNPGTNEAEMKRKQELLDAEQRMEQMEKDARKRLLSAMREQEKDMERQKIAKLAKAKSRKEQELRKRTNRTAKNDNTKTKYNGENNEKKLDEKKKKSNNKNDIANTASNTWKLFLFILFLTLCVFLLYKNFGNRAIISKESVVLDGDATLASDVGSTLHENPQNNEKKVHSKKSIYVKKRKKGTKRKKSEKKGRD